MYVYTVHIHVYIRMCVDRVQQFVHDIEDIGVAVCYSYMYIYIYIYMYIYIYVINLYVYMVHIHIYIQMCVDRVQQFVPDIEDIGVAGSHFYYGVATISRLLQIIGHFCRIWSLL